MSHESKSLKDIFTDIAFRKQRAAHARFNPPAASEAPHDVYLNGCEAIAKAFEGEGYRFARSGPHFARQSGNFTFKVAFQSSQSNVPGEYVALWIHVVVCSNRLKKWRNANESVRGAYDFVAGGQIGNLAESRSWLEWNLADPETRAALVQDAVDTIRRLALPYFSHFENPQDLCDKLVRSEIVGMELMNVFDFVACFSSISIARQVVAGFLLRHPNLLAEYRDRLAQFRQSGVPNEVPSGYVNQLAAISVRFGLGDLSVG